MSTHNICFRGEIRKILCGYPLLSVAMGQCRLHIQPSLSKLFRVKYDTAFLFPNLSLT